MPALVLTRAGWARASDVDVDDDDDDAARDVAAALWTTTTWLDMLNDGRRNRAFARAIERDVTRGDRCVDVGAGTGILAAMLARACGREGGVVAVEEYAPCAALARKIVGGDGIDVRCARSDEVVCETENERFDVMCAELLDSELVGEGWLKTAREARRRLTRGRGATIPRRGRTHARLVRCEKAAKYYGAIGDAASAAGEGVVWCRSARQAHARAWRREMESLSDDVLAHEFDFENVPEEGRAATWEREWKVVDTAGRADAVLVWWEVDVDSEGDARYSTRPTPDAPWTHHWRQVLFVVPEHARGGILNGDGKVRFVATHDDYSLKIGIQTSETLGARADAAGVPDPPVEAPWLDPLRRCARGESTSYRLRAVGMRLPEFVASKARLGVVCGVDLSSANALLRPEDDDLPDDAPIGCEKFDAPISWFHVFELGGGPHDADAVATSPETLFEFGDESSSFAVGARAVATLRADAPFDAVVVYIDAEDDVDPFDPERDAFATPFSIARRRQGVLIVPERSRAPSLQVWCAAVPGDEGFRFGILASS